MADPAGWAREALQVDVLPWQAAVLARVMAAPRVCGREGWHLRHSWFSRAHGWLICTPGK